jgi:hypothetical protein
MVIHNLQGTRLGVGLGSLTRSRIEPEPDRDGRRLPEQTQRHEHEEGGKGVHRNGAEAVRLAERARDAG